MEWPRLAAPINSQQPYVLVGVRLSDARRFSLGLRIIRLRLGYRLRIRLSYRLRIRLSYRHCLGLGCGLAVRNCGGRKFHAR